MPVITVEKCRECIGVMVMTSPVTCVVTSRGHLPLPAWRDQAVVVVALKRRHRRISVQPIFCVSYVTVSQYIPRISCHYIGSTIGCVIYPLYWHILVKLIVCVHSITLSTLFLAQSKFLCFHLFQIKRSFALLLFQFQLSVWYFFPLEVFLWMFYGKCVLCVCAPVIQLLWCLKWVGVIFDCELLLTRETVTSYTSSSRN